MAQLYQTVSPTGSDSNDGFSWNSPKATIAAGVAALPNGGAVYLAPTGESGTGYQPTGTITLNGHVIEGMGNTRQSLGTGNPSKGSVKIEHGFNGNLFEIVTGKVKNCTLYNTGTYTGAALYGHGGDAALGVQNAGYIYVEDVIVTGTTGWERAMDMDGSNQNAAGGPGLRSLYVANSYFFGATTVGETIRLNRVVHAYFNNWGLTGAPTAVTQGVKILHTDSTDIYFNNSEVHGTWYTEGNGAGPGILFNGYIEGAITCAAGSGYNKFVGIFGSTFTNSGAATNARTSL